MADSKERIAIIGGGHNGLTAAIHLAQSGFEPIVLERRDIGGGLASMEEIHPGFRCPTVFHATGPFIAGQNPGGLASVLALHPDGRVLRIDPDPQRTAAGLAGFSAVDAVRYPEFHRSFGVLGAALRPALSTPPPDLNRLKLHDYLNIGKLGLQVRGLNRKDQYRLLRYAPMAAADVASEWFENDLLRAVVSARGVFGRFAGPSSPGSGAALLSQAAYGGDALLMGAGVSGLAEQLLQQAAAAGVQVRMNANVRRIRVRNGRAQSVVLENGDEVAAGAVASSLDPQHTFLQLVEPSDLDPEFLVNVRAYRAAGVVAKVNLALSRLPSFSVAAEGSPDWARCRIHIAPDVEYLERAFDAAKYGEVSARPYMDICIPSAADSALAPDGCHVMSIHVQYAPYHLKNGGWDARREEFGDAVVETLSAYAPKIRELIVGRRVITPLDMERTYGLTGGHIFHGEHALDQLFAFRPVFGWSQYRTPIRRLYLCGAGAHPGGGITGVPGANAARQIVSDLRSGRGA